MVDYENSFNPFPEKRNSIAIWKEYSQIDVDESTMIIDLAEEISKKSVSSKDSLHVSCAVSCDCNYFITTDEDLITKLKN